MPNNLRKLLHSAEGHSQRVVVIFLDVRGFSSFAKIAESSDAAEFLTSTYTRILDDYFPDAAFVKLTGDGMLVLYDYDRQTLTDAVQNAVTESLKLLSAFPTITEGDPMINFDVPTQLGIGLARGAATRISSGRTVLDYSGRPLNLAARLMDLARPAGVVIDDGFGFELLTDEFRSKFERDHVYIRSIAEGEPRPVYFLPEFTKIPEEARRPLNAKSFTEKPDTRKLSELLERGNFQHLLTHEPAKTDDLTLHLRYPATQPDGAQSPLYWTPSYPATYRKKEGRHYAMVNYNPIVAEMKSEGVQLDWPVRITIEYAVRLAPEQHTP
ncbi:MAG TPA: adenylate/guanylate cyclase domain-containing protein [Solirubrobacteraceae bacterium]|nr:adenylate/guanylate cyclase domain-containing protein [Solirubrobacteraceae bacterium]